MIKPKTLNYSGRYIAVSSTYRKDPWNIIEWLEYHLILGVDHFFIYNNDPDPFEANLIFKPYVNEGKVTLIHSAKIFKTNNKQQACHNDALRRCKALGYHWMAMLDSDEFIYPLLKSNLKDVMFGYEDIRALCLNYANFGSSGYVRRPYLQIQAYLHRAPDSFDWNRLTKAIGQVSLITHCDHHHKFAGSLFDENKVRCRWHKDYSSQYIRINHYMARSKQDFIVKMERGNPLGEKRDWGWFNWADRNEIFDDGISRKFGNQVREACEARGALWRKIKEIIKFE